jgi:hypothetical protein
MIPTLGETLLALAGLWRFVREGAPALRWFDRSLDGFWRSFGVAIIVAPLQAVWIATQIAAPADAAGWLGLITTEASIYVILWVAFPLALYYIVARPGHLLPYVDFVIIYNWINIPLVVIGLAIALLGRIGLIGDTTEQVLMAILELGILCFEWFIARQTLRLGGMACAGLVALDFAILIMVEGLRIEFFAS